MGKEYKIKFSVPAGYNGEMLRKKMPLVPNEQERAEAYSCAIESDGFYFLDTLVNVNTSSLAFRRLVNEALLYSESVVVDEL